MKTKEAAKHTPGPWKDAGEFILGADNTTICQARDEDAWDANARLIAAAPELLAALESIAKSMRVVIDHPKDAVLIGPALETVLSQARAAIAKAEGR